MSVTKKNRIVSKDCFLNIILLFISTVVSFVLLEVGLRTYKGNWEIKNFSGVFLLNDSRTNFTEHGSTQYHETLGWVPGTGTWEMWGEENVTILEDGIRSNGRRVPLPHEAKRILAAGDSFTFGHRVADHETWPAILENMLQREVLNAGVSGYGIDQTFLRAKKFMEAYHPDLVIVSLIPDDMYRAELAVKSGVVKPYFIPTKDGTLQLKNTPVPYKTEKITKRDFFRKVFGYSFLVHSVVVRLMPNYWIEPGASIRAHHRGFEVSCLLIKELSEFAKAQGTQLLVLIQYDNIALSSYTRKAEEMRMYLEKNSIPVVDMLPVMQGIKMSRPDEYERLFVGKHDWHMSAYGNKLTAEQLKAFLDNVTR